ncbi:MAG TPA: tripartite tricarboxylate transporter substrate-binding protein [Burkholderiaceae bacterium]|nr:tripartite tricarboxylate transporter substrate-binding protein [Burkholderiaceae bacterium]
MKLSSLATRLLLAMAAFPLVAMAQSAYPSRAISLTVGFSPGGPTDTVGRAIAQKLASVLGQTVIVENKPGADGRIQLQHLAHAPADGYQIGLTDSGLAVNALLYKTPPYDVNKDFTLITYVGDMPNAIAVPSDLKIDTLKDFLAYARARPGKLNYAATASSTILATEMLLDMANLSIERVRYKGAAVAFPALMTGEIQLMVSAAGTLAPFVKQQGKIKALAVTSKRRTPVMPDVPTTAEAGLPDYVATNWYAIVGPANMPAAVVEKLNAALQKVLADRDVVAQLERIGITPDPAPASRLESVLKSDLQKFDAVINKANLKTD